MALRAASSYTLDLLSRFSCKLPSTLPEGGEDQQLVCHSLDNSRDACGLDLLTYVGAKELFVEVGSVAAH